jgi:hypothetical protein
MFGSCVARPAGGRFQYWDVTSPCVALPRGGAHRRFNAEIVGVVQDKSGVANELGAYAGGCVANTMHASKPSGSAWHAAPHVLPVQVRGRALRRSAMIA